jgi:sulfonate dioxygenase
VGCIVTGGRKYGTNEKIAFYDPLEKVEMVGQFEHDDPGHRADPSFPNLLDKATNVVELSPHCGTELQGVQIVRI